MNRVLENLLCAVVGVMAGAGVVGVLVAGHPLYSFPDREPVVISTSVTTAVLKCSNVESGTSGYSSREPRHIASFVSDLGEDTKAPYVSVYYRVGSIKDLIQFERGASYRATIQLERIDP